MWLQQLSIANCRAIVQAHVELGAQFNVFIGVNGSGKSSLLEAICLLSRGRSFRTSRISDVIRHGEMELIVSGKVQANTQLGTYPLGIRKTVQQTYIRINHQDIYQQSELSRHVPLTLIHPDNIDLASGSPIQRRALLDWIAFYRESEFHAEWRSYQRALKQRNVCLREANQRYALGYWTDELVRLQASITRYRQSALRALLPAIEQHQVLLQQQGVIELQLSTGFPQQLDVYDLDAVRSFLQERQSLELKQGMSLYGPHRGDLQLTINQQAVAKVASRGQLKLLGIVLLLAQSNAITHESSKRGIIAIDDLASELDQHNQDLLYTVLGQTTQQLIITGTRPPLNTLLPTQTQWFHVEQGVVSPVSAL